MVEEPELVFGVVNAETSLTMFLGYCHHSWKHFLMRASQTSVIEYQTFRSSLAPILVTSAIPNTNRAGPSRSPCWTPEVDGVRGSLKEY